MPPRPPWHIWTVDFKLSDPRKLLSPQRGTRVFRILQAYSDRAGTFKGHYFYQDLLIAKLVHDHNPNCHFDKGPQGPLFIPNICKCLQRGHDLVADLKIGRDTLHVIVVFQSINQLHQLFHTLQIQLGGRLRLPDQLGALRFAQLRLQSV